MKYRTFYLKLLFLFLAVGPIASAQKNALYTPAEYLIVVTTDGLRWQEVFEGADSAVIADINSAPARARCMARYSGKDAQARRQRLMPFFWKQFGLCGQVYGNRKLGNRVTLANKRHISYPGYSEIFCGFPDDRHLLTNAKKQNPNKHVLEWFNTQAGFEQRVLAVGSWDVFPYIFNELRANFMVNAGFEPVEEDSVTVQAAHLNDALANCQKPWKTHLRPDTLTWAFSKYYWMQQMPKVLFIGFGETDEYAHEGNYAGYLDAAARFDTLLQEIWTMVETHPVYKGKTAVLVTTDHGRGKANWRAHHALNEGSDEVWFSVAGPSIFPMGEMHTMTNIRQAQLAQTMAHLIGLHYTCTEHPIAPPIEEVFVQPNLPIVSPLANNQPLGADNVPTVKK